MQKMSATTRTDVRSLPPSDSIIYRSTMHAGLKRNVKVMPRAEWLELLLRHVPDCYEHLVRNVGWYTHR